MGFLDDLLGKGQKKQQRKANDEANKQLDKGYAGANPLLDRGYTTARTDLTRGRDAALAATKGGYDTARKTLEPWAQSGLEANEFYDDLLGLDGTDARDAAQGVISSDKLWQGELAQGQNAMLRYLNARGASGGGKAALAGQRVLTEQYGNWMDRYRQRADTGGQYARDMAQLDNQYGINAGNIQSNYGTNVSNLSSQHFTNKANLTYGYRASKAGQAINHGNAMVAARNSGVNNVLGVVGAGVDAYGAYKKAAA